MMLESAASGSLVALVKSKPPSASASALALDFCLEGMGGILRSLEIDGVRSGGSGISEWWGGLDIVSHVDCICGSSEFAGKWGLDFWRKLLGGEIFAGRRGKTRTCVQISYDFIYLFIFDFLFLKNVLPSYACRVGG